MLVRAMIMGACGALVSLVAGPLTVQQMLGVAFLGGIVYTTGMFAGRDIRREVDEMDAEDISSSSSREVS